MPRPFTGSVRPPDPGNNLPVERRLQFVHMLRKRPVPPFGDSRRDAGMHWPVIPIAGLIASIPIRGFVV